MKPLGLIIQNRITRSYWRVTCVTSMGVVARQIVNKKLTDNCKFVGNTIAKILYRAQPDLICPLHTGGELKELK